MPRSESSRPTSRIQAILDEYDQLEIYTIEIETIAGAHIPPDIWKTLPPRPVQRAVITERARQQFTGQKVRASRAYRARQRHKGNSITVEELGKLDQS
jgi:hypothetical protein